MDIGGKIGLMFFAFILAVMFSWLPWLMYIVVASVFTFFPCVNWAQVTFFTWATLTLIFWEG